MSSDLRAFLELVRRQRPADYVTVRREVDPRHETTAILAKLEAQRRSPILFFERVRGSSFPLVTNVCGSTGRLALALGCSLREVAHTFQQACLRPVKPAVGAAAPVQENSLRGAEVDLGILPPLVYHEDDADSPYITGGIVTARDPETAVLNLSFHRLMILGRNETAIFMEPGKHLDRIYRKYADDDRAMPIAAFIGAHPLWALGAVYSGAPGVSEYDVIGGLLGEPLEVVDCVSQPSLYVPARAEFVLEGEVSPTARVQEGPFGEFTGYGTGVTESPVFRVSAMTFRDAPVFQDVVSGHMEHLILPLPALETRLLEEARAAVAAVRSVALVAPLTAVVSVEKTSDEEPQRILEAVLQADIYSKHVFIVDGDVDPGDLRQVMEAVALNVQSDRDVTILRRCPGTPLDPSCEASDGLTAKMGIDATRAMSPSRAVTRNRVPRELWDSIDLSDLIERG